MNDLGLDVAVNLDVALGQLNLDVVDGVVSAAALLHRVPKSFTIASVAATVSGHIPIDFVVRHMLHTQFTTFVLILIFCVLFKWAEKKLTTALVTTGR